MGTSGAPSEHPRLSTFALNPPALPIYSGSINLGHHSLSRDRLQRRPAGPPAGPARTAPRAHLELRVASCGGRPGSEGLPLADSGRLRRARAARLAATWPSSEASTQGRGHVGGRRGSCAGSAVGRLDGVQAEEAREGRVGGPVASPWSRCVTYGTCTSGKGAIGGCVTSCTGVSGGGACTAWVGGMQARRCRHFASPARPSRHYDAPSGTTPALRFGCRVSPEEGVRGARGPTSAQRDAHLVGRESSTGVASIARPARLPRRHTTIFQFIASASKPPLPKGV